MLAIIRECVRRGLLDLHSIGVADAYAEQELKKAFVGTIRWVDEMRAPRPDAKPPAVSIATAGMGYALQEMCEIEENVWSPFLGLKGKIDMIARADCRTFAPASSRPGRAVTMPVELKTGRWKSSQALSHRAQVILYLLALLLRERGWLQTGASDRSAKAVSSGAQSTVASVSAPLSVTAAMEGILLYLSDADEAPRVDVISPSWAEVRALVLGIESRHR